MPETVTAEIDPEKLKMATRSFGEKVVTDFNRKNDLDLLVRAHQVVDEGYEFFANRPACLNYFYRICVYE